MSDLEQQLRRQQPKPVPSEWRTGILSAAATAPCAASERPSPGWRALFFEWRRTWATLAASWVLILLGHLTMPGVNSPQSPATFSYSAGAVEAWREQQQLLAELFPQEHRAEPPKALPPRRRTERGHEFYFA
jgi:hypothetical protein